MKYKPVKKPRRKRRPISDLLDRITHVLRELLKGSNNINGIYRILQQTGFKYKYKPDILDSIYYLEKGRLIHKNKDPANSMKKIISLTDIGKNTAKLVVNTENYIRSMKELNKVVETSFDLSFLKDLGRLEDLGKISLEEVRTADRILKNRGWTENERAVFIHDKFTPPIGVKLILDESPKRIFDIILLKYQSLINNEINQVSKKIIEGIIINLVTGILQFIHPKPFKGFEENENYLDETSELVTEHSERVSATGGLMYHFIYREMIDVLDSMFSVAEPRKQDIRKRMNAEINWVRNRAEKGYDQAWDIDEIIKDKSDETWDATEVYKDKSMLEVIPFFEKIAEKWG